MWTWLTSRKLFLFTIFDAGWLFELRFHDLFVYIFISLATFDKIKVLHYFILFIKTSRWQNGSVETVNFRILTPVDAETQVKPFAPYEYCWQRLVIPLSKPHTGTANGLRHGTQFGMSMKEGLVTVCVEVRGNAGGACQAVARISKCSHHGTHWHALSLDNCT